MKTVLTLIPITTIGTHHPMAILCAIWSAWPPLRPLQARVPAPASSTPRAGASKPAPATAPPVLPLASQSAAVLSVLHKGRTVLLWLTLAHLAAWLLFDRGSIPLLIFMAAVWVAFGRALPALTDIGQMPNMAHSGLERLQQEIRSLAQQRQHQKAKNEN